jgi:hypothetical protein
MQETLIVLICAGAAVYAALRIRKSLKARKGCDCGDCAVTDCERRE